MQVSNVHDKKLKKEHGKGNTNGKKLKAARQGLGALMGAATLGTKGIVVTAPMVAAYLVRNKCSRFIYSHNF